MSFFFTHSPKVQQMLLNFIHRYTVMTCNNYVNIKEINNLVGANKLGPSLKKRRKGKEEVKRTQPALSFESKVMSTCSLVLSPVKNYGINSAQ